MITSKEEDRIEAAFPTTVTVSQERGGATIEATYELDRFWAGPDQVGFDASKGPDHPVIVFDWDQQSEEHTAAQPVDNIHRIENPIDEPEYTEVKASEQYDDLTIQVAVRADWRDELPPTVRLNQLTRPVWQVCDREFDKAGSLNDAGENGERPMTADIITPTTRNREERTLRSQWTIRLYYRDEYEAVQETAAEAEFETEQLDN